MFNPTGDFSKTMKEDWNFSKSLSKFSSSLMGSKIPIHLQAKMEIAESEEEYKKIMQPRACYNEYPSWTGFTGTKVHPDQTFRIRPQTPKINLIELR